MDIEDKSHEACRASIHAIEDAIYVIGGKWKLRIIVALRDNPMRFNEIQRMVSGISAKVLSNELKELELNGLVNRKVHDETPVKVVYSVTTYSQTLEYVLNSLVEWGQMHREHIKIED